MTEFRFLMLKSPFVGLVTFVLTLLILENRQTLDGGFENSGELTD